MRFENWEDLIGSSQLGRPFILLERIDSTNDYIKSRDLPNGAIVIALEQFAGRGRLGREWVSKAGEALSMSVLIKSNVPLSLIPIICAVAVAKSLSNLMDDIFLIKWPNDIIYNRKKVCGILCESKITNEVYSYICGFGVNLTQDDNFFENQGLSHAGSIKIMTGEVLSLEKLAAEIIRSLDELIKLDFFDIINLYRHLCVTLGQQVCIYGLEGERIGTAVDVDETGKLVVKTQDDVIKVNSGEVSVRGLYGYL